jgi:hypothetical protein
MHSRNQESLNSRSAIRTLSEAKTADERELDLGCGVGHRTAAAAEPDRVSGRIEAEHPEVDRIRDGERLDAYSL